MKADQRLCRAAGVDVVFAPADTEMYPADFSTAVEEEKLAGGMEGAARPGHFRGVTTIVAKLFNVVRPTAAVFGAKDFQQAAVIRRMTRGLEFSGEDRGGADVARGGRAGDEFAQPISFPSAQREQATVLWQAIKRAQETVARRPAAAARLRRETAWTIAAQPEARLDYVEFFDPETLQPVKMVKPGTQMALAVFVGRARLIDNAAACNSSDPRPQERERVAKPGLSRRREAKPHEGALPRVPKSAILLTSP